LSAEFFLVMFKNPRTGFSERTLSLHRDYDSNLDASPAISQEETLVQPADAAGATKNLAAFRTLRTQLLTTGSTHG